MATIRKIPSGKWRVQVRRKGQYVSETFLRKQEADEWALMMERKIDRGDLVSKISQASDILTVEDMISISSRMNDAIQSSLKYSNPVLFGGSFTK